MLNRSTSILKEIDKGLNNFATTGKNINMLYILPASYYIIEILYDLEDL